MAACLVAAVCALSGPPYGGAPGRVFGTLDAIGTPERIEGWIRERVLAGERIMGFGHPVYRTEDPCSWMLRGIAQGFGGPLVDFAVEVERQVEAILAELKPGRELHTNVEFYAGVVMELCGLPRECSRRRSARRGGSDGAPISWSRRRTRRSSARRPVTSVRPRRSRSPCPEVPERGLR